MFWRAGRQMRKITTKAQQDERLVRYHRLLAKRPGLSPACKRALWSAATKQTLYPEQRTRAWGLAMRGKRAAKACHEAQRRNGHMPGARGSAAVMMYRQSCRLGHRPDNPRCGPQCQRQFRGIIRTGTYQGEKILAEQLGVSVAQHICRKLQESASRPFVPPNPRMTVFDFGYDENGVEYTYLTKETCPRTITNRSGMSGLDGI